MSTHLDDRPKASTLIREGPRDEEHRPKQIMCGREAAQGLNKIGRNLKQWGNRLYDNLRTVEATFGVEDKGPHAGR